MTKKVILLSSIAAGLLLLSNCSGGGDTSDTDVVVDEHQAATLKHINSSRTIIYEGETTVLSAVIYNGSAEDYEFYWQASEGHFSDAYSQNTTYIAPSTDGANKYINIYVSIKSKETGILSYGALTTTIKDGDAIGDGSDGASNSSGGTNSSSGGTNSSGSNSSSGTTTNCDLGKGTYCTDGCLDANTLWKMSTDTIDSDGTYDNYVRIFARLHSPQNINDELTRVSIWWPSAGITSTNKAFPDLFLQNNSGQENAYVNYSTDLFGKEFYYQYFDMDTGDVYCEKGTFPATDFGFIPDSSTEPDTSTTSVTTTP